MADGELEQAVARIRASPGYKLLVAAYRWLPVGVLLVAPGLAAAAVGLHALAQVILLVATAAVGVGVGLFCSGMLWLRAHGLTPRGGTSRHRAMVSALWRDVLRPLRRAAP